VSLPITTRLACLLRVNCRPAAWPSLSAISGVIAPSLARPRTPSVPKSLRAMSLRLALLLGLDERAPQRDRLPRLGHVVHPYHLRPLTQSLERHHD
jgi:hypothetical protein